jgi:pantoate ligase/cytidylate kinase
MLQVCKTIFELRNALFQWKLHQDSSGETHRGIGFVPTMGALHPGHASLFQKSCEERSLTVASIFVNPLQFGPSEDFHKYPRTLENDLKICEEFGVQIAFVPDSKELYPSDFCTKILPGPEGDLFCGAFRPGHFEGVLTVVMLLCQCVQPTHLYMGSKDFQQVFLVRRMLNQLKVPIAVVAGSTVRETGDGLALSSRNRYLDATARKQASLIPRAFAKVVREVQNGTLGAERLIGLATEVIKKAPMEIQYLELVNESTLAKVDRVEKGETRLVFAGLLPSGEQKVRLIDNLLLSWEGHDGKELKKFLELMDSLEVELSSSFSATERS